MENGLCVQNAGALENSTELKKFLSGSAMDNKSSLEGLGMKICLEFALVLKMSLIVDTNDSISTKFFLLF
jgi:hypothetical protein